MFFIFSIVVKERISPVMCVSYAVRIHNEMMNYVGTSLVDALSIAKRWPYIC